MAFAIIAFVLALLYSICVCCCWGNIRLGASVMESASDFVSSNLRVIFLPVVAYIISMAFFCFWLSIALYLYSIGEAKYKDRSVIADIQWEDSTRYIMWYNLFGLLWCVAFFICLQQFIIAAMTCMWYFSGAGAEMSDATGEVSMMKAVGWGCWYHCGSIAFGSFLIALVTLIRIIFEYMADKADKL